MWRKAKFDDGLLLTMEMYVGIGGSVCDTKCYFSMGLHCTAFLAGICIALKEKYPQDRLS